MRWKICEPCAGYGRKMHVDGDGQFFFLPCMLCGGRGERRELGRPELLRIDDWAQRTGFSFPPVIFEKLRGKVMRCGVVMRTDTCSGAFTARVAATQLPSDAT